MDGSYAKVINCIYEHTLKVIYKDYNKSFHGILELANSIVIHHRNLQTFALKVHTGKNP